MKTLHDMLVERHSIRRYTTENLNAEDVKTILEAALLSPTSKSSRAWQFIVVDDKNTLLSLAECKVGGTVPLKNCVMAVAVVVDPERSEAWIEDGSVAATMMHLQAAALGIGSCWVEVRGRHAADGTPSEEIVREVLGVPETLNPLCIVTFGYSDEKRRPVDLEKLQWEKVHIGTWKNIDA